MKLVSHLPKQTFWLYLGPVLNVLLVLLLFFLLGSTFVIRSGVSVTLPQTGSRLSGFDRARVITVSSSGENPYYLDGVPVTLEQLREGLKDKIPEGRKAIIHGDVMTPYGWVIRASSLALSLGYEVAYATQPESP